MAKKVPSSISCSSSMQLDRELELIREDIELIESEETWDKILAAILRISALAKGSAADYPTQLVAGCKRLARPINNSMISERSRLSGAATDMLATLAMILGRAFEPLIPVYVPGLLSLASRPNKVFISRSKTCLKSIAESSQSPFILPLLRNAIGDKSVSLRLTATDTLFTCLNCFNPPDIEHPARAEDIEAVIRATARDASADVRKSSKQVFEAYSVLLPHRLNAFIAPLTPIMRKYLSIKSTNQVAPATKKSTLSSSVVANPLPAPKKEASSKAKPSSSSSVVSTGGPSRVARDKMADSTVVKKPASKPPTSGAKPTEMLPPPPRPHTSGPMRPPPDMRHQVAASSRPFTGHPFRPNSKQTTVGPSSTTGGFNSSKSQGVQRPEKPTPAVTELSSAMSISRPPPATVDAPADDRTHNGMRRVPKVDRIPSATVPQKPSVNVKEQDRTPIDVPLPPSPSSSSSNGPSRAASRAGKEREPVFRKEEKPKSQGQSTVPPSSYKEEISTDVQPPGVKEIVSVIDTRTEDLTLEELTTVRPLPQPHAELPAKSESATIPPTSKVQRPLKSVKEKEHASQPASQTEKEQPSEFTGQLPSIVAPQQQMQEKLSEDIAAVQPRDERPRTKRPPSRAEKATLDQPSSRAEKAPAPSADAPQPERVRREKRHRAAPTTEEIPNQEPSGSKRATSSSSGKVSSSKTRDGKRVVRTKEEEEARAARKAAKRRKLEMAKVAEEREAERKREEESKAEEVQNLERARVKEEAKAATEQEKAQASHIRQEVEEEQGPMETDETATSTQKDVVINADNEEVIQKAESSLKKADDEPMSRVPDPEEDTIPTASVPDVLYEKPTVPLAPPQETSTQGPSQSSAQQPAQPSLNNIRPLAINKPSADLVGTKRPRTPERPSSTGLGVPSLSQNHQFVTPAPLRRVMNSRKRNSVAATPISKMINSIERGFDFDFSIMEETEEEVATASACGEEMTITEEDENEDMDIVTSGIMTPRMVANDTNSSTVSGDLSIEKAMFVDSRPRRGKRSVDGSRRPLGAKSGNV